MKVGSSIGAAEDAASGFGDIEVADGTQVSLSTSNIGSMQAGAKVADGILPDIAELVYRVKAQAASIVSLANEIEGRDASDAQGWCEAR